MEFLLMKTVSYMYIPVVGIQERIPPLIFIGNRLRLKENQEIVLIYIPHIVMTHSKTELHYILMNLKNMLV